jgi:uncharacterized membrane protein YoaK (UPF0700 family)
VLSARAYSLRMQVMLAISLSWVGGFTNVITFLCCDKAFISHMTGNSTNFGRSLAESSWQEVLFYGGILVAFFTGAAISAALTEGGRQLGHRSNYILPLGFEALLLAAMMLLYKFARNNIFEIDTIMPVIGAFAMGIQNATITKISGSVVRTTHVTGVITDLGLEGMQYLLWCWRQARGFSLNRTRRILRVSQRHPTAQRLLVLYAIFLSFVGGVIGATLVFPTTGAWALICPILFLGYLVSVDWRRPIADIRELDPMSDPELRMHGLLHSLLPPELTIFRLAHLHDDANHATPNYHLWLSRIPAEKKVVILVFSPLMKIKTRSIADLEDVVRHLEASGRALIVAGLTPIQYRILDRRGFIQKIGIECVYPDLEFAIAHASSLIRARHTAHTSSRKLRGVNEGTPVK